MSATRKLREFRLGTGKWAYAARSRAGPRGLIFKKLGGRFGMTEGHALIRGPAGWGSGYPTHDAMKLRQGWGIPVTWLIEKGALRFVVSHPSEKNKDVARVGHPFSCPVGRSRGFAARIDFKKLGGRFRHD